MRSVKNIILTALITLIMTGTAMAGQTIATLDGTEITKQTLENYVNNTLGDKYRPMLDNQAGMKKLAGYYIDRQIILAYAKKNVSKDNDFMKSHVAKTDMDTQLLTTVLKEQVNDKAMPTSAEVDAEFKKGGYKTRTDAGMKLVEQKRLVAYSGFIKKLRSEHKISYK